MKRPPLPLAIRILLLAVGNLMLIALAFMLFLRVELHQQFGYFLMTAGRDKARAIAQQLSADLSKIPPAAWDQALARQSAANGITLLLYDHRGAELAGPRIELPPAVRARLTPSGRASREAPPGTTWLPPFIEITKAGVPYWLGVWMPLARQSGPEWPSHTMLVVASSTLASNPFFFEMKPWFGIAGIALGITILCWLPLIINLTRSIAQMMSATAGIAEGHFDIQIGTRRKDELGHLSTSINRMAARLDVFARGRNRFLGDVAHELRSPLGRMQAALAILEHRISNGRLPGPFEADALGLITDLREEVELMSGVTEGLLTFARSKLVPEALQLAPTNLAAIVCRAVKAERVAETTIRTEVDPGILVKAEPEYLFRSVANVIRNAVRYAGHDGEILIAAQMKGEYVLLSVSDSGPGIPEEALDRIFTPFYRLDASRDRRSGGTGLGLAIVRECVEACGGSVACCNRKPSGLEVTITLRTAQPALVHEVSLMEIAGA
jgi:two-component system sensor histidine kinase CpxA